MPLVADDSAYQPPPRKLSPAVGLLLAAGGCGLIVLVGGVSLLTLLQTEQQRHAAALQASRCLSNGKQVAMGVLMYSQDYDERLPPAATWSREVFPYVKNSAVYVCPAAPDLLNGYGMNARADRLALKDVSQPALAPLLFESGSGTGGGDPLTSFVTRHPGANGNRAWVSYVDGHVKWATSAPPADQGLKKTRPRR